MKHLPLHMCACLLLLSMATSSFSAESTTSEAAQATPTAQNAPTTETSTVVVTATRTEQLLEDVPASMEVITSEDIENMGASTVEDALKRSTNITSGGARGGWSPSIRGLGGDYTLVLINGRRTTATSDSGFMDTKHSNANALRSINVNAIERIEVLRGTASALYGSDAVGGVINIITKKSLDPSVTLGVQADNYKTAYYTQASTGVINGFDAMLNFKYNDLNAVRTEREKDWASQMPWTETEDGSSFSFDTNLGYEFNPDHKVRLYVDYAQEDHIANEKEENGDITDNRVKTEAYGATLVYDGQIGDHIYSLSAGVSNFRDILGNDDEEVDWNYTRYMLSFQDSWTIADWNTLTFGGEWSRMSISDNFFEDNGMPKSKADTDQYAFYIQDEISLFDDRLYIIPAVRYDKYEGFDGQFSPKIGVSWEFFEGHFLKGNYGYSFKAPTLHQMYVNDPDVRNYGTDYIPNPDLKPEKGIGWEITYSGRYENVFGSITYFENTIEDKIERSQSERDPANMNRRKRQYINVNEATSKGVEVKLGVNFLDHFTLTGYYDYLDTHQEGIDSFGGKIDGPLYYTTKNTYTLQLTYNNPEWDFDVSIWGRHYDDMWVQASNGDNGYADSEDRYISFSTLDITARKTWADKYTVFAGVYNLLSDAQRKAENHAYVGDLEWRVGVEVKF